MNQQQLKQLLSDIKKQPSNDKKWEILTKLLEEIIKKQQEELWTLQE